MTAEDDALDAPTPDGDARAAALDPAYLRAATQCLQLWQEVCDRAEVPAGLVVKFRVSFSLIAHAMNHVAQALEVIERYPLVAATSARVALEHALTAQWVLLTKGGEETLVNHMKHSWMMRSQEFANATNTHDKLKPILDLDPIPGSDRGLSARMLCDRFDSSGLFYDTYRDLSQAVHPTHGTITAHFEAVVAEHGQNSSNRIAPAGGAERIGSCATGLGLAAVLAVDAFERLRDGSPRLHEVGKIATTAGLPHDLRYSDQVPGLRD
ncbi:hypothetical protein [Microbacterium sp.]|uniref:hypothetical protein n=1 Tax=Microbacterium sp. TaxID=51671 RepID=UPI0027328175|nr:hypothetical protein [Microbacterium sp.]MDP3950319.1 hypothetical protein [Microbacterium sp.]